MKKWLVITILCVMLLLAYLEVSSFWVTSIAVCGFLLYRGLEFLIELGAISDKYEKERRLREEATAGYVDDYNRFGLEK